MTASAAPTRRWITRTTSTMRVVSWMRARTSSPGATVVAGFAGRSLTRTCPARQAAAASGRVLVRRTAHSHRSTRVESTLPMMPGPPPPDTPSPGFHDGESPFP